MKPNNVLVYGVGFYGIGHYKAKENGKNLKQYEVWRKMLQRCYDPKYHQKYPTYIDCEVCEEWHNYQNFAKWFDENYYEIDGEKMCFDKDIIIKGNKIYSPETSVFVPQRINKLFTKRQNYRGKYPVGVTFHKQSNSFRANISNGSGKMITLGNHKTPEDAFESYKVEKEKLIKTIANEYKGIIPDVVYDSLMNYEVEITD